MAHKPKTPSRFDYKIEDVLKRPSGAPVAPTQIDEGKVDPSNPEAGKVTPQEVEDRKDKEVEIPVGGITQDGVIFEQVVRPDGNTPIYKEVNIDNTEQPPAATKKEETTKTEKTDTTN